MTSTEHAIAPDGVSVIRIDYRTMVHFRCCDVLIGAYHQGFEKECWVCGNTKYFGYKYLSTGYFQKYSGVGENVKFLDATAYEVS